MDMERVLVSGSVILFMRKDKGGIDKCVVSSFFGCVGTSDGREYVGIGRQVNRMERVYKGKGRDQEILL